MTLVIIVFGLLTIFAGIVIAFNPELIFDFLRNNLDKLKLHILAVVVRLILGILLIYQSGISKFPLAIEIIGWISIVAAIVLGAIGRHNFKRLMSWALLLEKSISRLGGGLAIAFGAFLVYAFV